MMSEILYRCLFIIKTKCSAFLCFFRRMTKLLKITTTKREEKPSATWKRCVEANVCILHTHAPCTSPAPLSLHHERCPYVLQLSKQSTSTAVEEGEQKENKVRSMATQLQAKFEENAPGYVWRRQVTLSESGCFHAAGGGTEPGTLDAKSLVRLCRTCFFLSFFTCTQCSVAYLTNY